MGTNETILRLNQAGLESTRGTAVAATRKLYAQIEPSYEKPLAFFTDASGTFAARRRASYGRERVAFSATDMATYEDLAWWMQMAVKSAATPTGSGSVGYTYAFTPTLAADDLKSMTLEFGESGNPYEADQVMVNSWTLRGDPDSDSEPAWMFEAEMMGRTLTTTTYTASLTDRTTEPIVARGTKLYVDAIGGTIGTTQVTGKLINWTITGNNNIHYKAFAEDETAMAANKVGRGERTYDAEVTVEFDGDSGNLSFATLRAGTALLVRLQREGSTIATTYKKRLQVDLAAYVSSISFGDREGNMTATLGLQGFYDPTFGSDIKVGIINALATLA